MTQIGRYCAVGVVAAVAVATASGCATTTTGKSSSSASSASASGGSSAKVAAVIKPLNNPYFAAMGKGISDADPSAVVQAGQSLTDTSGQADLLSTLIGQGYGCYIVNPITGNNLLQGVAQLKAKSVPVVNIDSPVDAKAAKAAQAMPDTYIGTDNVAAGKIAGRHMASLIHPGAQIGVIGGIVGDVTSGDRITGFKAGLGSKGKVVATAAGNWDRPTALTKAQDIVRAHPQLAGFFVANDDMAIGVARAVADAHKTGKVFIVSVDGILPGLKAVKAGQLSATVAQYPYAMGQMGVEACREAMAGKSIPSHVTSPVALITKKDASQAIASAPRPFKSYDDPFAKH